MNNDLAALQFASLGHAVRVAIVRQLVRAGPAGRTVLQLRDDLAASQTPIPATTFNHHLKALVDAGLIYQHREGREVYSVPDFESIRTLITFLMRECCVDVEKPSVTRLNESNPCKEEII